MVADLLSPRESGVLIAKNATHIKINDDGVRKVANMIHDSVKSGEIESTDYEYFDVHTKASDREAVDWIFFMDVINFSFWTEHDDKWWLVSYKCDDENKGGYSGYFASCACANRALDSGIPLTSAEFMATVTEEKLAEIFTADNGTIIPMLKDRHRVINEAGKILLEKFDGTFYNCVKQCNKSAQTLLKMITEHFPSFRDCSTFKGKQVSFLKRAQILVSDIHGCLRGCKNQLGDFDDIKSLTMFADYRVPQVMAYLGVIQYSDELLNVLRKKQLLENGSEMEVELRGCSIFACDKIAEECEKLRLAHLINEKDEKEFRKIYAVDVDMYLWIYRRRNAKEVEAAFPFHRVRCIYY